MSYRTRRADLLSDVDQDHLRELHDACFGDSAPVPTFDKEAWWLIFPMGQSEPAAFAGCVPSSLGTGYAYHKRAGVMPIHRGHGLQRRLISIRERWARREGFHTIVTDTCANTPSANNLIRAGYELFDPKSPWGLKGGLYFRKSLA